MSPPATAWQVKRSSVPERPSHSELALEAEKEGERRARGTAETRDDRGCSLLAIAAQHNHKELVEFLLTYHKSVDNDNIFLEPGETSMEAKTFKVNVNAKDSKGWNCVAIAVFHNSKDAVRLLLQHGADREPGSLVVFVATTADHHLTSRLTATVKNNYNKSAVDLAKDELDAAENVYVSHAEIRAGECHGGRDPNSTRASSLLAVALARFLTLTRPPHSHSPGRVSRASSGCDRVR